MCILNFQCPPLLQCPFEKSCTTVGFFLESFHTVVEGRGSFLSPPILFVRGRILNSKCFSDVMNIKTDLKINCHFVLYGNLGW